MKCGHCRGKGYTVMYTAKRGYVLYCENPLCRAGQEPDNGEYWMCSHGEVLKWEHGMDELGINPVFRLVKFVNVIEVAANEFGMDFAT